jgi:integrase
MTPDRPAGLLPSDYPAPSIPLSATQVPNTRGHPSLGVILDGGYRICWRVEALALPGARRGSPFSGWSKAKAQLDELSGVTDWRLHDLRRTVATGLQRLGIRLEVTEAVLNHVSGSRAGIVGVYQTHDYASEKREALSSWARHMMDIV